MRRVDRAAGPDFFFFQAEDGIRDRNVTGVQTCALPICVGTALARPGGHEKTPCHQGVSWGPSVTRSATFPRGLRPLSPAGSVGRSEERRVGKEGSDRGVG